MDLTGERIKRNARHFRVWLVAATVCLGMPACGDTPVQPSPRPPPATGDDAPTPGPQTLPDTLVAAVREAYRREFNEDVPYGGIANDPLSGDCTGLQYLTTIAYLPAASGSRRILAMYMTRGGSGLVNGGDGRPKYTEVVDIIPAGTYTVLTAFVLYPDAPASSLMPLEQAQTAINAQHEAFARSRHYSSPIVRFAFTNIGVARRDIPDPRSPAGVRTALSAKGIDVSGFDFVATLNPEQGDPAGGGKAFLGGGAPHFVYYGTGRTLTSGSDFDSAAATLYHHEIGHHWGWQHDWTPSCGGYVPSYRPFITDPVLFGWEDTDRDGVPEILDSTPYGRTQPVGARR